MIRKILRNTAFGCAMLLVIAMAAATVLEKIYGSGPVFRLVYHSPVFIAFWAVTAVAGMALLLTMKSWRKPAVAAIHFSFVLILAGALVTHLCGDSGTLHLRQGDAPSCTYVLEDGRKSSMPFAVSLESFEIEYYHGSSFPMDYVSGIVINDCGAAAGEVTGPHLSSMTGNAAGEFRCSISMNNICRYRGYRFYQTSYDEDGHGTVLSVSHDPYGVTVTYAGYALLLLSFMAFFFSRDSGFRIAFKNIGAGQDTVQVHHGQESEDAGASVRTYGKAMSFVLPFLICSILSFGQDFPAAASERMHIRDNVQAVDGRQDALSHDRKNMPKVLPRETAAKFGDLYVCYNGRIAPMQTLARDFTMKLYGKPSYRGLTAEQVLTGWIFHYDSWKKEPVIRIKEKSVRKLLGIEGRYASLLDFFTGNNVYKLDVDHHDFQGEQSRKAVMQSDEKFNVISMACAGSLLKIFPYATADSSQAVPVRWFSPADNLPLDMPSDQWIFVRKFMSFVGEAVSMKKYDEADALLGKLKEYQLKTAGSVLPSGSRFRAERLYNMLGRPMPEAMLCLTAGILLFVFYCIRLSSAQFGRHDPVRSVLSGQSAAGHLQVAVFVISVILLLYLTFVIALRWHVSGHVPMSNGFETMMFMAWLTMLFTAVFWRRFPLVQPFGFILTGFCLLVAVLGESNPQITLLMPVLSSPLLSLHVASMMISYSLFGIVMLNGVMSLTVYGSGRVSMEAVTRMKDTAVVILYPAVFFLVTGTFLGAVWANVSWGRYWAWDPKEVWALITMLVYSFALHGSQLKFFRNPVFFHWFCVLAFLCVLITYFGVNFILGGLHSYA